MRLNALSHVPLIGDWCKYKDFELLVSLSSSMYVRMSWLQVYPFMDRRGVTSQICSYSFERIFPLPPLCQGPFSPSMFEDCESSIVHARSLRDPNLTPVTHGVGTDERSSLFQSLYGPFDLTIFYPIRRIVRRQPPPFIKHLSEAKMLGLQSYSDFAGVSFPIETEGCIVSRIATVGLLLYD